MKQLIALVSVIFCSDVIVVNAGTPWITVEREQ